MQAMYGESHKHSCIALLYMMYRIFLIEAMCCHRCYMMYCIFQIDTFVAQAVYLSQAKQLPWRAMYVAFQTQAISDPGMWEHLAAGGAMHAMTHPLLE